MPLVQTRGAASAQGFGEFAQVTAANYIEDVFSCFLYTGNGSTQTITNGIDLSGKGGLVWLKARSIAYPNFLIDTVRGRAKSIRSDAADAEATSLPGYDLTSFNSNGFSLGPDWVAPVNTLNDTFVSWTFREQPKFFDVVTYTGDGIAGRTVAHNLGSVPGCIIVKRTDGAAFWGVYHRGVNGGTNPEQYYLKLDGTDAQIGPNSALWNSTAPTSTEFSLGTASGVNFSGGTYVAYLFAHNAGGFGLAGTDNVISCGSFTTDGSGNATVSLGYEPQWMMLKTTGSGGWFIRDTMRGFVADTSGTSLFLRANDFAAEGSGTGNAVTATGTQHVLAATTTYIYIAIRRGPMKVPTLGTSVFAPITYTGTGAGTPPTLTTNFPVDMTMFRDLRTGSVSALVAQNTAVFDRLRSSKNELTTSLTAAEDTTWGNAYLKFDSNTQMVLGTDISYLNASGANYVNHSFRRAPGFFDEVCYTGTGTATTFSHNLGVAPELMIVKERSSPAGWWWNVYYGTANKLLKLNTTDAETTSTAVWNNTAPTSSVFSVGAYNPSNTSGSTYVAYLFATCPGVSKVGSYTGNGTTQTINCGFTGGARFVLIKRTDSTGDWYVYDTARGMTVLTDPYLLLNSTAAEVATLGSVTTVSTGFALNSAILAAINVSAGTYIFLAIA